MSSRRSLSFEQVVLPLPRITTPGWVWLFVAEAQCIQMGLKTWEVCSGVAEEGCNKGV